MRKYPAVFVAIGFILFVIGINLPPNVPGFYWLTLVLCGVGGFMAGFSLRHLNKEEQEK